MSVITRSPADITASMLNVFASLVTTGVDRNPGSIIRTIFEAAALLDAEQFVQVVKAMDAFYIDTAAGDDLSRRAQDFGVTRFQPAAATATVVISDSRVTAPKTSTLASQAAATDTTVVLVDASAFPASGSVILSRENSSLREKRTYTKSSNTLTVAALTYTHPAGSTVTLSVQGADTVIPAGTKIISPATAVSAEVSFSTSAQAVLYDGDRYTSDAPDNEVFCVADVAGSAGNIVAGKLTQFRSPPFQTAAVYSSSAGTSGRDLETDREFRNRIKATIQGLPASTLKGVMGGVIGLQFGGITIQSAEVVESPIVPGDATLYVDDGSENGLTKVSADAGVCEVLATPATTRAGDSRGKFRHVPIVPGSVRLFKSPVHISKLYKGVGTVPTTNTVNLPSAGWGVNELASWILIDSASLPWGIVSNTSETITLGVDATPSPGPFAVFNPDPLSVVTPCVQTIPGPDWGVNYTTGDVEYAAGVFEDYDALVAYAPAGAAYQYYGGIIEEVQKTVNGDPFDLNTYPGLKAMGVKINVTTPTYRQIPFMVGIVPESNVTFDSLTQSVKNAVRRAVNVLRVHEPVTVNKVLMEVLSVPGVFNATIITPAQDVAIGEGEIAKTTDTGITVV